MPRCRRRGRAMHKRLPRRTIPPVDTAVAHVLHRDIETRSILDLTRVGGWRYATDPTTGVWCLAFAVDDQPAQLWTPDQPAPEVFFEAARNPDWLIVAHNDAFERAIEGYILAPL